MHTEKILYGESSSSYISIGGARYELDFEGQLHITSSIGDYSISPLPSWTVNQIRSIKLYSGVVQIGSNVFKDCVNLTTISPYYNNNNNIKIIGENCFSGCTSLTSISSFSDIERIENSAFKGCSKLTTFSDSSSFNLPSTLTFIGENAFDSVGTIQELTINCKLSVISDNAFANTNIKKVNIPNFETNKESLSLLQRTGIASSKPQFTAGNLKGTLSFPLDTSTMTYNEQPVTGTSNVSTVAVSSNLPRALNIDSSTVSKIKIPTGTSKIGTNAFLECSSINSVLNLDSVTQIGENAFKNCTNINNLVVPNIVTSIGTDAFKNVPHIDYTGTATGSPWGALTVN